MTKHIRTLVKETISHNLVGSHKITDENMIPYGNIVLNNRGLNFIAFTCKEKENCSAFAHDDIVYRFISSHQKTTSEKIYDTSWFLQSFR